MSDKTIKIVYGNTGNSDYLRKIYKHDLSRTQPVNENDIDKVLNDCFYEIEEKPKIQKTV